MSIFGKTTIAAIVLAAAGFSCYAMDQKKNVIIYYNPEEATLRYEENGATIKEVITTNLPKDVLEGILKDGNVVNECGSKGKSSWAKPYSD